MIYKINTHKLIEGANELAKLKINELEKISLNLMINAEKEITKIETWKSLETNRTSLIKEIKEVTTNRLKENVLNTKFYFHKLNESLRLYGKEMPNTKEYDQEAMNILNNFENKLKEYAPEHIVLNLQN